jgi:hypothetical protein
MVNDCIKTGLAYLQTRQPYAARPLLVDRDAVAAITYPSKGAQGSQGLAGEAMKGNLTIPVILRVDAS